MATPEAQDRFNPFVIVCPTGKKAGKYTHFQAHLVGSQSGHFIGTFKLSRGTPIESYAANEVEKLIKERKWDLKNVVIMTIGEDLTSQIG